MARYAEVAFERCAQEEFLLRVVDSPFGSTVAQTVPWPDTALSAAKDIKNSNRHKSMIKCFHDYHTVLHEVNNH